MKRYQLMLSGFDPKSRFHTGVKSAGSFICKVAQPIFKAIQRGLIKSWFLFIMVAKWSALQFLALTVLLWFKLNKYLLIPLCNLLCPYYQRFINRIRHWFQLFYNEMDAIVMIEDDNNTSSSVHSLSNTKSNNSNYFFEGKTEIIRSKVSNTYLVFFEKSARIFELVIVYLNNFIRILTSQKFSEVAFEVVVSGQNNLITCGLAKRSNVNVQLFSVALNYLSGNPGRDHLLLKSLNESVKAILQSVDNLLSDLLTKINKIRYHLINKNPFTLKNMYLPHIFNQEGDHPGYS